MHYIIGTTILVTETVQRTEGPVSITDKRSRTKRVQNKTPFETNVEYNLYNIRKDGNDLLYKFSDSVGNVVDLRFQTATDADRYIASVRKEALPDYEAFHRNNRS